MATIKGDKTVAEFFQQFEMHPNQISIWKRQFIENAEGIFGGTPGK